MNLQCRFLKWKKIVINIGVGDAVNNSKFLEEAVEELTLISRSEANRYYC